ncbi:MAG: hypothetical protein N2490_03645 [Ignavibacteria bacterium]|nr:hypothetical protein [Ignavibacteria bacterium]
MLKKLLVSLFVVVLIFAFTAATQAQNWPGDRAGKKADYLWKKLKLTDEQYVKVYQTLHEYEKKVDALKAEKKDKKAREEEMKKLQAGVHADFTKIFTKEQSEKYEKFKDKFFKKTFVKKKRVKKLDQQTTETKKEEKKEDKNVKKEEKKDEKKKDDKKKEEKKEEKKDEKKK